LRVPASVRLSFRYIIVLPARDNGIFIGSDHRSSTPKGLNPQIFKAVSVSPRELFLSSPPCDLPTYSLSSSVLRLLRYQAFSQVSFRPGHQQSLRSLMASLPRRDKCHDFIPIVLFHQPSFLARDQHAFFVASVESCTPPAPR